MFKRILTAGLLAGLFFAPVAQAAAPPSLLQRTTVLMPPVPEGWVVSNYASQGGVENAEFTPPGQTGDTYIDLIGFNVRTAMPNLDMARLMAATKASAAQRCASVVDRDVPAGQLPIGWQGMMLYCTKDASDPRVELTLMTFRIVDDSVLILWRARRESVAGLTAFVQAQAGRPAVLASPNNGVLTIDEAAVDTINAALTTSLARDLASAEVCDLARGDICPSLRAPDGFDSSTVAMLSMTGTGKLTARQTLVGKDGKPIDASAAQILASLPGDAADKPVQLMQTISLDDHDWANGRSLSAALMRPLLGAHSGGGTLTAMQGETSIDAATRARMQAYVIQASRLLWNLGVAPQSQRIILTPAPKP